MTNNIFMSADQCGIVFGSMLGTVIAWLFITGIVAGCISGIIKAILEYKSRKQKFITHRGVDI